MTTSPGPGSTACPVYEVTLEDYLNGELSVTEAHSAEEHWKACVECRVRSSKLWAASDCFVQSGQTADPGPRFARVVMARVREAERERRAERAGFWQPLVAWGWKFAATATLVLAGLVTYDAGWGYHPQPNAEEVRPIAMHDIFSFDPNPGQTPADRDEVLMMVAETSHGN